MTDSTDNSWLDLGDGPGQVTAAKSLVNEKKRGAPVSMTLAGKGRTWHSDGKYIWFRRKKANPATLARLSDHLARGEIKHLTTSDDVEMYEVLPSSAFYRAEAQDLTKLDYSSVTWATIRAAKRREWTGFVDGLSEIAARIKGRVYTDGGTATGEFARLQYSERLNYIFRLVSMAGGPGREEIDREVSLVQQRRGAGRGSTIVLPPPVEIARA